MDIHIHSEPSSMAQTSAIRKCKTQHLSTPHLPLVQQAEAPLNPPPACRPGLPLPLLPACAVLLPSSQVFSARRSSRSAGRCTR
jgi:hypothetical protein